MYSQMQHYSNALTMGTKKKNRHHTHIVSVQMNSASLCLDLSFLIVNKSRIKSKIINNSEAYIGIVVCTALLGQG